ncbi:MAG TPA: helix-turn-helix domain-containing protein, partial [Syntrophorhabdus sp.]|nr:helix-turn-helix domain-containing protein [Syntrophorhabdus sp.]
GDWTQWCEFFLKGVTIQAEKNQEKAQRILQLYNKIKLDIAESTRSQYAIKAVDFIFRSPIFTATQFIEISGIPQPSVKRIVHVMAEEGIISPLREAKGRRAGLYSFDKLLNITEGENLQLGGE